MMNMHSIVDMPRSIFGAHVGLLPDRAQLRSSSVEERLSRLELLVAGQDILSRYAYLYDAKELDALLALYAEDATLINSSGTYAGLLAIRAAHEADLPRTNYSFHHFTTISVTGAGPDMCVSAYLYNMAAREDQPYGTVASVIFRLVLVHDVWKIVEARIALTARHALAPIGFKPAGAPPYATGDRTSSELIGG